MNEANPADRIEGIETRILALREQRILLDADLAELYGVTTGNLNKAVQRNLDRFPSDFMFHLTAEEVARLRFHSGTSSAHGGRRFRPYAFTEQGVAMLSSVLHSPKAAAVNIEIMRAFVRLRGYLAAQNALARKLADLEAKFDAHDDSIRTIFETLRELMEPPEKPRRKIGFHAKP